MYAALRARIVLQLLTIFFFPSILDIQAVAAAEYQRKKGGFAMTSTHNTHLIGLVKEITVAKLSNPSTPISHLEADSVANFMQTVYDKLVELDSKAS